MSKADESGKVYLDVWEAARRYSVTPSFFRNKMRTGQVPHHKIGKYVRFKPDELDRWFQELAVPRPTVGNVAVKRAKNE